MAELTRPTLPRNLITNFGAMVWSLLLNLAFVPVYVKYLGVESYGLVGLFATIQVTLNLLDVGLSPTMTREMAFARVSEEAALTARDLARTLEVLYWLLVPVIIVSLALAAPVLARHWIGSAHLSLGAVTRALVIVAISSGCQWPISFYAGGLRGLEHQVRLNAINIVMATLRYGGAAIVISHIDRTVTAFFIWQAGISAAHTAVLVVCFWYSMPRSDHRPRLRLKVVRKVWRFAAGLTGITLAGVIITQADKIVISGMLSLEEFGYYSVASVVAQSLTNLVSPITAAVFPRFVYLATVGDISALRRLFSLSSQVVAVVISSVGLMLVCFASEVLFVWTGNADTAQQAHVVMSLLVFGAMVGCWQAVPYAVLLANGMTRIPLILTSAIAVIAFPLLFVLVSRAGVSGACIAWVGFNTITLIPNVWAANQYVLQQGSARWYVVDTLAPLMGALLPVATSRVLWSPSNSRLATAALLIGIGIVVLCLSAVAASELRSFGAKMLRTRIRRMR